MYRRYIYDILLERLAEPRQFIQVIAGPRQVGKSTMVNTVLKEMNVPYIFETADGQDYEDSEWISRIWASARANMQVLNSDCFILAIDEIHKLNNWSEYVKKEWDKDTLDNLNIKVVILGSSRLLLKYGLDESLAGRFEIIRMSHWDYPEMREAFGWTLEQYIYYGGYPGSARLISDERRWKRYIRDSIVSPSVDKDVIMTTHIYKPELMRSLFNLGCAYSGKELSLNKMLGQLQESGNVTTLSNYLTTLGEANLLCGLSKYANDDARRYNSVPKLQVFNQAFLTVATGNGFKSDFVSPERWGRWVESAIGAYLVNHADENDYKVYYWRERNDEVDFILRREDKLIAIEVKSGRRGTNAGLEVFTKKYNPTMAIMVGTGGIPLDVFLSSSPEKLFNLTT